MASHILGAPLTPTLGVAWQVGRFFKDIPGPNRPRSDIDMAKNTDRPFNTDLGSLKPSLARDRARTEPLPSLPKATFTGPLGVDIRAMKPSLAVATRISSRSELLEKDGHSFEQSCAELLRANGWQVTVTPPSGDYGADIIASR